MKNARFVFALLLVSASAEAQKKPASKPVDLAPLSENVTVAVTNLEVVVTDSKGNRVPGLKKQDFQVFEDGIPQPLTNFYAVSGGRTTLSDGSEVSLSEEPRPSEKQADEVPANLKTKYVIYVDNLNMHPLHRTRIFKTVLDFVDKTIGPNAEGMVVAFNRSLKVKQKFTSDKGILVGALEGIMSTSAGGTSMVTQRQDALQRINDAQSETDAIDIAKQAAQSQDDDLHYSIDGLKTTLHLLAGVEGRKVLIYISDGLPESVGLELFDAVQAKFQRSSAAMESFTFDRTASYATIAQEANAQGVTLYMIDAAGLQIEEGVSAEHGTNEARVNSFVLQQNYQAPLQMLAKETGGIAAINTNSARHEFDEIAHDFSDFYSLGYRSTRGAVDRPHSIEVKVLNHPGLRARYRSGYLEKTVETRTAEAVTAALYYPRSENPLRFSVAVGDPKPYSSENYLVPIRMSIPLQNVTFIPEGDFYRGRLYVYFVVLDSEGQQSDLQIRPLEIKIDGKKYESARKKDYGYDVQLIMIPGAQRLSVAIRDGVSNSVSFSQKGVFVSVLPAEKKKSS